MNDDTKLWLFLLTAGFLFLFVAVTGIQRYQIKKLYQRIDQLETTVGQHADSIHINRTLVNESDDNLPPLEHRVFVLELEVWDDTADFQVPSELDKLRVSVGEMSGAIDWLKFAHYDQSTSLLTISTELRHVLEEICHYDPKYNFCADLVY